MPATLAQSNRVRMNVFTNDVIDEQIYLPG